MTCTLVAAEHLGGTFFLKKVNSTFNLEKRAENQTATFVFPIVDISQQGSYFCKYVENLAENPINLQGVLAKLSGTVHVLSIALNLKSSKLINTPFMAVFVFLQ